jgi:hypothetical protein
MSEVGFESCQEQKNRGVSKLWRNAFTGLLESTIQFKATGADTQESRRELSNASRLILLGVNNNAGVRSRPSD